MSSTPADKKKSRSASSFPMPSETWDAKLREHHERVGKAKSSIPKDAPFKLSFRSPRQSPRGPRALPLGASSSSSLRSPRGTTPSASASARSSRTSEAPPPPRIPLTVDGLAADERDVCESLIRLLQGRSSDESKELLESIYVQSETRRLLRGYGGVFSNGPGVHTSADADE